MDADRRSRFIAWFQGAPCFGDRARLTRLMGDQAVTKGRLAQYFDEDQPFGERAARALAERLGLPSHHFEHETSAREPEVTYRPNAVSPADLELLRGFTMLPQAEQAALRQRISELTAHVDRLVQSRLQPRDEAQSPATEAPDHPITTKPQRKARRHRGDTR
jgi:hypothetical protein